MIYFECFKNTAQPEITATGYVYENKTEINMSSIYSKLIQEAGRYCDRFASDLLYDIQSIEHHLEAQKSETLYIGFRRYGVDNNAYIATKIPQELDSTYRVIYSVKIDFEPDEYYLAKVQVTLNEVYYSTSDHEWPTLRNSKKEEN